MRALAAVALLPVLLAGCGTFGWGRDEQPMAELVDFEPTAEVERLWSKSAGADVGKKRLMLTPLVREEAIYVSDNEGQVSAFAPDTGRRLWRVDLDRNITAGVGDDGEYLFLGTREGQVVALRRRDGSEAWTAQVSSEILAPPLAGNGVVVVQTVDGKVFGLALEDGRTLWVQERTLPSLTLRGTSTPALAGRLVLAGFGNGRLAAFTLQDGRQVWEVAVAQPRGRNEIERLVDVNTAPVIDGNVAYVGAYQGRLVAVNTESGSGLWAREMSTYTDIAKDANNVYVSDEGGEIYAIDAGTGATLWRQDQLRGRQPSGPALTRNYVVVGDVEGYLHFLRKEDGAFVARHRVGRDAVRAQPKTVKDRVYVLDQGARLTVLQVE